MRIAVVSDIHGNLAALEAVVADFTRRGVDAVVNLGDALSGPLLPLETARYLMATGWRHLAGNHERQVLATPATDDDPSDAYARSRLGEAELGWIAALPHCLAFDDEILLCHGTPRQDNECLLETIQPGRPRPATATEIEERLGQIDAAVVLCGHTHIPRIVRSRRGALLVNPGSVGQPAWYDELPFYHAVENGVPDARYAIVERHNGAWRAESIALPYDHRAMADLAIQNGRPDWESILCRGYVEEHVTGRN
ncbi:MAG: metallophosphoesterase family protein [Sterolibacteriaceae bacterium]|uniref:metallophosphoesterase family protein n=1 Tax=Sulfuritalea sp. TaxID=2480090 RepID=UPI001A3EF9A3|nr:metallophosphoesterase family protein [Sulfuritalea sp.]MBL8479069.1 metallophosphoesterase family protein [Sterolibacteriaceae bacterium]MBN8477025.1 metallophosphoesterase family protein [Sulfuritalea sp.]